MTSAAETKSQRWIVWLPAMFWTDHAERCCEHEGEWDELRRARNRVQVSLDKAALENLRSDANYYGGPDGPDEDRALRNSAQRTMIAIHRLVV